MNPLYVSRASQQITLEELPEGVREEFLWRAEWSVYRLPDWVRSYKSRRVAPPRKSVELAKLKAEHGQ